MDIENLKKEIRDKELRLSQLRAMDAHQLTPEVKGLIVSLEEEITTLKRQLGEE